MRRGESVHCPVAEVHESHIWVPHGFPYPIICNGQLEEIMPEQALTPAIELRLSALDRAINYFYGREATADEVVRVAGFFELYLKGLGNNGAG